MKKVFAEQDIPVIAEQVMTYIEKKANTKGATVVALSGDLGAGKTTLTKEIARLLRIKSTVISPTFVLLKSYPIKHANWNMFHHIDAYRLEDPKDILKLGWEELLQNPKNLLFVEWPERIEKLLPEKYIKVALAHKGEVKREIIVT